MSLRPVPTPQLNHLATKQDSGDNNTSEGDNNTEEGVNLDEDIHDPPTIENKFEEKEKNHKVGMIHISPPT